MFFFFKQKTAYEMRISDWSSDVCSSDLGTGMDVHQPLARPRDVEQRVATGGHLAEPGADHDQQVAVAHPGGQLRVDADADMAGIVRVPVVEMVLAAERSTDRQRVRLGEPSERIRGRGVPAAAEIGRESGRARVGQYG